MRTIIALCTVALLSGCALFQQQKQEQPVAIKYKYVVMTVPEEMLEVSPIERKLDTTMATDKDAAKWMIDWERRYQEIERRLKMIKTYQDRRLRELTLPPEDVIKN